MTALDSALPPASRSQEPRTTYFVDCHRCRESFDAAHAPWCQCLAKERTLVCAHCGDCFCRADSDFKLTFWTSAPAILWERKLKLGRQPAESFQNLAPEDVKRPLVLVVDDDRDICALAARVIGNETRLGVIVATDGAAAIDLAHTYKPDVVITDALMPKIDGREVCRTIKNDEALGGTKVLIMSSVYTSSRFRREALTQFKADDFLVKPVSPSALRESLERALGTDICAEVAAPQIETDARLTIASTIAVEPPPRDDVIIAITPVVEETSHELPQRIEPIAPPKTRIKVDDLIRLHHAGVDPALVQQSRTHGYDFSIDQLIELRMAGVSADLFRHMNTASDTPLSVDDLRVLTHAASISDRDHVARLLILGFTPADIARLVAAGVDAAMLEELQSLGYNFTVTELVRLKASGVSSSFIAEATHLDLGELTAAELITLTGCGINTEVLHSIRSLGVEINSVADLLRLRSSGISDALLSALRG